MGWGRGRVGGGGRRGACGGGGEDRGEQQQWAVSAQILCVCVYLCIHPSVFLSIYLYRYLFLPIYISVAIDVCECASHGNLLDRRPPPQHPLVHHQLLFRTMIQSV